MERHLTAGSFNCITVMYTIGGKASGYETMGNASSSSQIFK